jgi:hypothetical protein
VFATGSTTRPVVTSKPQQPRAGNPRQQTLIAQFAAFAAHFVHCAGMVIVSKE